MCVTCTHVLVSNIFRTLDLLFPLSWWILRQLCSFLRFFLLLFYCVRELVQVCCRGDWRITQIHCFSLPTNRSLGSNAGGQTWRQALNPLSHLSEPWWTDESHSPREEWKIQWARRELREATAAADWGRVCIPCILQTKDLSYFVWKEKANEKQAESSEDSGSHLLPASVGFSRKV